MSNKKKVEALQRLQQYTDVTVFALADEKGSPLIINEGIIVVIGNRIFALSEDSPFEDYGFAPESKPLEEVFQPATVARRSNRGHTDATRCLP